MAFIRALPIALVAACVSCAAAPDPASAPAGSPAPSESTASSEDSLPAPNVRGRDVRLLAEHGVDHPSPEVLPCSPVHLVVGDCEGLELFDVDDLLHAEEYVELHWWDVGIEENRSLTILTGTPSCLANDDVRRLSSWSART